MPDLPPPTPLHDHALHDQAVAARARGDHDAAVQAWRALLDAAPEDWALALELKRDLKAGLHYPDSDPRFRRAARHLPDETWLDHYAALYAFHGSDLEAIDARARALLRRWPGEPRLHAILGEAARQRRDWTAAATAFATAATFDPAHPEYPSLAAFGRLYARLATVPWPDAGPHYPIAVVNLDRNPERMVEIERQFAAIPIPRTRIPGIEGSRLAAPAVQRLTGDAAAPRGTLGCFLSHAAAWEWLLTGDAPCVLVIEDDTIPLLALPPRLGGLPLPPAWDLVFVNERLRPYRDPDAAAGFSLESLAARIQAFEPDENAPGGCGYLLSRAGATKLLGWIAHDGMADDVDWRLLAYALSPADIAAISPHLLARRELDRLSARVPRPDRLDAHVLFPPLIRTVGVSSDREDQNRLHPG